MRYSILCLSLLFPALARGSVDFSCGSEDSTLDSHGLCVPGYYVRDEVPAAEGGGPLDLSVDMNIKEIYVRA